MPAQPTSVFEDMARKIYNHRFSVQLTVATLVGGTPTDPKVAEGWIRTKMGLTADELVREEVERVMESRGVTAELAVEEVTRNRHLNGFKRDFASPLARADQQKAQESGFMFEGKRKIFTAAEAKRTFGELYFEGRQLKAALKEAVSIAVQADHLKMRGWGTTNKTLAPFIAEHLFVQETAIRFGRTEADRIEQAFVHTWRGSGIKLEEKCDDVELDFTLLSDYDFEDKDPDFYPKLFVTLEQNGVGASRSQGNGRCKVTRFERLK